jgi:NADPH-dependent curcumin reductase CurA
LTIKGFLEAKLEAQAEDPSHFYKQMTALIESRQMKWNEHVYEGLEVVGDVILAVQKGDNPAKAVVKVANP